MTYLRHVICAPLLINRTTCLLRLLDEYITYYPFLRNQMRTESSVKLHFFPYVRNFKKNARIFKSFRTRAVFLALVTRDGFVHQMGAGITYRVPISAVIRFRES